MIWLRAYGLSGKQYQSQGLPIENSVKSAAQKPRPIANPLENRGFRHKKYIYIC